MHRLLPSRQGFYSVSGSSLSDSCYSVSSEAAQSGAPPPARPLKLWDQVPLSTDNPDILWPEGAVQQQQQQPALQSRQEDGEQTEETPVSGELVQDVDRLCKNQFRGYGKMVKEVNSS